MHKTIQLIAPFAVLLSLPGQAPAPAATGGGGEDVTFTEHVAKIVFENCASCHRPKMIAPFPLTNYKEVRKRGRMIARVTGSRYMPPWQPVKGHGAFADELRLTDAQIATIRRWVKAGMPEGPKSKMPKMPKFTKGWTLGRPDKIVSMKKGFPVPAGGRDIYRNFVVELALKKDVWVTAIEVKPGARSVLHHIIFGMDTTGEARRADGRDGKPGFRGMRGLSRRSSDRDNLGRSTSGLGGWAVGGQPRHLPMGLAMRIPAGADLVLQSHLHPSGKAETERTTLGLYFTDKPPTRTMIGIQMPPLFGVAAGLNVPAGKADFKIKDSFTLPADLLGVTVGGHAHYICKDMHIWATFPNGRKKSVFWINNWDFDWQNRYQYAKPLDLPKGTRLDVEITYDNSANNPNNPHDPPRAVRWGLESTDEMGSVTLLAVAKNEKDSGVIQRAYREHVTEHFRGGAERIVTTALDRLKALDTNGDGTISKKELDEAQASREEIGMVRMMDRNRDGEIDAEELERAAKMLERMGRFGRRRGGG